MVVTLLLQICPVYFGAYAFCFNTFNVEKLCMKKITHLRFRSVLHSCHSPTRQMYRQSLGIMLREVADLVAIL